MWPGHACASGLLLTMEDTLSLFQSIGLSEAKAKDTIKNIPVSNALKSLILEVNKTIVGTCKNDSSLFRYVCCFSGPDQAEQ